MTPTREQQMEAALKKAIKRLISIEQKYQDNMTAYERKYNQMRKTLWDQFHNIRGEIISVKKELENAL